MNPNAVFICSCDKPKKMRLIFDGGSSGNYTVELCNSCYQKQEKKFLIKKEVIS